MTDGRRRGGPPGAHQGDAEGDGARPGRLLSEPPSGLHDSPSRISRTVVRPQRVLIASSDDAPREAWAAHLGLRGWCTEAVVDGEEALLVAPAFAPDVIVLDACGPPAALVPLAHRLRRDPRTRGAFIIACMRADDTGVDFDALHRVCDAVVTDTPAAEDLTVLVQAALDRPRG